jgi:hypothetical protein
MLTSAEAARRRELHRRAYAPGGSLTDAELVELRDLDNRNLIELAAPVVPAEIIAPVRGAQRAESDPGDAAIRAPRADGEDPRTAPAETIAPVQGAKHDAADVADVADVADAAVPAPRAADPGAPRAPRRRWLLPLVAAVAVLVGLGAGWLLFDPGVHRSTMTAAQQDVWSELEASGDYDAGSIQLVGEKYGATAWAATQDKAKRTCIVLTRKGLDPATGCRSSTGDYEGFDLQVNLDYTEDGDQYMLFALLVEDSGGNPVTVIQRQNMTQNTWDWRSQYTKDELTLVDVLESTGIHGESLNLLGYDGTTPIWMYQDDQTCLAVVLNETDVAQQCGTLSTDPDMPLQLMVGDVVYSVSDSPNRGPSLTIIRASASMQVTCDTETGHCTWVDDTPVDVD